MEVFVCVRTVGRQIDFGVATTGAERSAIQAQRFRVYQGRGYYRPGLTVDRDEYDEKAVYVLAMLDSNQPGGEVVEDGAAAPAMPPAGGRPLLRCPGGQSPSPRCAYAYVP